MACGGALVYNHRLTRVGVALTVTKQYLPRSVLSIDSLSLSLSVLLSRSVETCRTWFKATPLLYRIIIIMTRARQTVKRVLSSADPAPLLKRRCIGVSPEPPMPTQATTFMATSTTTSTCSTYATSCIAVGTGAGCATVDVAVVAMPDGAPGGDAALESTVLARPAPPPEDNNDARHDNDDVDADGRCASATALLPSSALPPPDDSQSVLVDSSTSHPALGNDNDGHDDDDPWRFRFESIANPDVVDTDTDPP
jgi:hypothetical protein